MPNRDFFALAEDHRTILEHVFSIGACRVFESYSDPDEELVEFKTLEDIVERFQISWGNITRPTLLLQLYPHDAGGKLVIEKVDLDPRKCKGATFRYRCSGWGLVQLYLESVCRGKFRNSHTNHNSAKRAQCWEDVYPDLGKAADWNWANVTAFSRKLNYFIDKESVDRIGSNRVLPAARAFMQSDHGDVHMV